LNCQRGAEHRKSGRRAWKREKAYYGQSTVETELFRYKSLLGGNFRTRNFERQIGEALTECMAVNHDGSAIATWCRVRS